MNKDKVEVVALTADTLAKLRLRAEEEPMVVAVMAYGLSIAREDGELGIIKFLAYLVTTGHLFDDDVEPLFRVLKSGLKETKFVDVDKLMGLG